MVSAVVGGNRKQSVLRDATELGIGYGLILATVWTINPWQRWFYWTAFLWIAGVTFARREGVRQQGLGWAGFAGSLWVPGAAVIGAALAALIAFHAGTLHGLHGPTPLLSHVWGYLVWAVMQQFLLQSYFLLRLLRILPTKGAVVIAAAGLFALAHLPNPVLTPITFVWGIAACLVFLHYRNVYTLGAAHGILGLCVAVTVPSSLHHNMRVGIGYYRYRAHGHKSQSSNQQAEPGAPGRDRSLWLTPASGDARSRHAWILSASGFYF